MSEKWNISIGVLAEDDLEQILQRTLEDFGERQAAIYEDTLLSAIETLGRGPDVLGSKSRDDIFPGLRTLHVARRGRKGRHFVLYEAQLPQTISVLRILHDAMDLGRHITAGS